MSNIYDELSFGDLETTGSQPKSRTYIKTSYQKIGYLGGEKQVWPMKIRILINPHHKQENKHFHETATHARNFNGRWIMANCPRVNDANCPLCDKYFSLVAKSKERKAKSATVEEISAIEKEINLYKPKKSISVLAVESGSKEIKLFNMGIKLAEKIFGKSGVTKGVLETFKEMDVKWYSPTETMGWIEIKRTGVKLDTEYSVNPCQVVNKETRTLCFVSEALQPEVVKIMNDKDNMYRIKENFTKNLWSHEELTEYADSKLTVLPERIARMYKVDRVSYSADSLQSSADQSEASRKATVKPMAECRDDDDIPF
jgi:hypothetical protein